jgi:DNA-binding transcriptional LysR family regulator
MRPDPLTRRIDDQVIVSEQVGLLRRFPLYAVYPSRLHRAAKVRAFIEFCLEIMDGNKSAVPRKAQ